MTYISSVENNVFEMYSQLNSGMIKNGKSSYKMGLNLFINVTTLTFIFDLRRSCIPFPLSLGSVCSSSFTGLDGLCTSGSSLSSIEKFCFLN